MAVTFRSGPPEPAAYHALFETTGWNEEYGASPEELDQANRASWLVVSAWEDDDLVGFGRVVSDGVLHAMVYDLIVRPDRQGTGIGSRLLDRLVRSCRSAGIRDVQLFCAKGKRGFYERRGFLVRSEDAPGMQLAGEG